MKEYGANEELLSLIIVSDPTADPAELHGRLGRQPAD